MRSHPLRRVALAALLVLGVAVAHSATIYRWVDEKGRTHLSDVVPEKYRKSAKRTDSGQYEVPAERRKEAEARAAKDKARAAEAARARASQAAAAPASAASAPAPAKRPAEGVTESTDCDTWWRLFQESQDCFGPFRNVKGGIKPEAFEQCNPIPSPELKCGPLRQYPGDR